MLVTGGNDATATGWWLAEWYSRFREVRSFTPPYAAIGWFRDPFAREVDGAAIFNNLTPEANVDIHIAFKRFNIRMRNDIYRYAFRELKCARMTGIVPQDHTKLIRFVDGLGFHREGSLLHQYGKGSHAFIYGFYEEDARKVLDGRTDYKAP